MTIRLGLPTRVKDVELATRPFKHFQDDASRYEESGAVTARLTFLEALRAIRAETLSPEQFIELMNAIDETLGDGETPLDRVEADSLALVLLWLDVIVRADELDLV